MKELPLPAQRFVKSVVATGAALLLLHLLNVTFSQPMLFLSLLGLSLAAGSLTVALPFTAGVTTMSVSYAVDFASMMLDRAQCDALHRRGRRLQPVPVEQAPRKPLYETLFNMAMLVVTVQVAGSVFTLMQAPNSQG